MASNEEIKNIFNQFKEANKRLNEALCLKDETAIKRDAVIKRFEFTFELLWKTFKRIARFEKLDCFGPKDAFKIAFKLGLIENEELFLELIDARNKTTHVYPVRDYKATGKKQDVSNGVYSEEEAKKIYSFIKEKAINAFAEAEKKIEQRIK